VQLGDLTGITYDGTAKAATVTTVPQGVRVLVKYDGSVTAPVEAGSYAVSASTDDPNYDGSASGTLVIAKARAALKLEQLEHKYDGSQKSARVTSDPQGVVIISTRYNELPDAPVRAGSYAVRAWLTNRNYGATPVTGTLLIQKATQAIDFAPLAHHTVGDAPVALSARGGSSTSPVQYALGPASVGCSLSGSTLSIDAATADGQACTVVARQAGDDNYEPAADVAQSFTIGKAAPRIAWATPADLVFGAPLGAAQLNAAAIGVNGSTVGGSFSYSPAAGTELSVGNYTLTATFTPTDLSYGPGSASVPLRVRYLTTRGHQFIDPFGGRAAVKIGPKLYFAFQLFKADGQTPVSTARATMVIQPLSPTGTLGEPVTLTEGNAFAFESHLQLYWFDLKTKDLAPGTYRARAMLDDGSEIVGEVSVTVSRGRPDDETTATPPSVDRGRPKGDKDDKDDELAADPRRPVETKPPVLRKP